MLDGELGQDPAVRELVVLDDRVAVVVGLARAAKALPDVLPAAGSRSSERAARLVEDRKSDVDPLDVLGRADRADRIRWGVERSQSHSRHCRRRQTRSPASPLRRHRLCPGPRHRAYSGCCGRTCGVAARGGWRRRARSAGGGEADVRRHDEQPPTLARRAAMSGQQPSSTEGAWRSRAWRRRQIAERSCGGARVCPSPSDAARRRPLTDPSIARHESCAVWRAAAGRVGRRRCDTRGDDRARRTRRASRSATRPPAAASAAGRPTRTGSTSRAGREPDDPAVLVARSGAATASTRRSRASSTAGSSARSLDCHANWTAAWHLMRARGLDRPPTTVTLEYRDPDAAGRRRRTGRSRSGHGSSNRRDDRATVEAEISSGGIRHRDRSRNVRRRQAGPPGLRSLVGGFIDVFRRFLGLDPTAQPRPPPAARRRGCSPARLRRRDRDGPPDRRPARGDAAARRPASSPASPT